MNEPPSRNGGDPVAEDLGSGAPLVLIHGLGSDSRTWNKICAPLSEHRRIINLDLPSVSMLNITTEAIEIHRLVEIVLDALDSRGIDTFSLVGHSYGGAVALGCAAAAGDRLRALTLIAPGGFGYEINPFLRWITSRSGRAALDFTYRPSMRSVIDRFTDAYRTRRPASSEVDGVWDTYIRLDDEDARAQFRRSVVQAMSDRRMPALELARVPGERTQIVWGAKDMVLPVVQGHRARQAIAGSQLHVVPNAGHTPHRTHAPVVIDLINQLDVRVTAIAAGS